MNERPFDGLRANERTTLRQAQQLSLMSRVLGSGVPMAILPDHEIEYGQELAHTGGEGHFLGFACRAQPVVKGPEDRVEPGGTGWNRVEPGGTGWNRVEPGGTGWNRVEPGGHQGCHVQGGSHLGAPTPHFAFSPQCAAVAVEGRNTDQGGNLIISPRFKAPSSGRSDKSVMDRTGPTPGVLRRSSSLSLQIGEERMRSPRSRSKSARFSSNQRTTSGCAPQPWGVYAGRRFGAGFSLR